MYKNAIFSIISFSIVGCATHIGKLDDSMKMALPCFAEVRSAHGDFVGFVDRSDTDPDFSHGHFVAVVSIWITPHRGDTQLERFEISADKNTFLVGNSETVVGVAVERCEAYAPVYLR